MTDDPQAEPPYTRLPSAYVDRLTKPFARFLHIEAAGGAVLLLFTAAALILSNSPGPIRFWISGRPGSGFRSARSISPGR
ncbi:hypothetical protein [Marinobacterium aestuariivivens]|uniref:Uncharacterized protein n=1 Tax=Marinobacterium aestuariivivens TaxID=1698799 RepID=A0ABW2A3Q2_9GAMM